MNTAPPAPDEAKTRSLSSRASSRSGQIVDREAEAAFASAARLHFDRPMPRTALWVNSAPDAARWRVASMNSRNSESRHRSASRRRYCRTDRYRGSSAGAGAHLTQRSADRLSSFGKRAAPRRKAEVGGRDDTAFRS